MIWGRVNICLDLTVPRKAGVKNASHILMFCISDWRYNGAEHINSTQILKHSDTTPTLSHLFKVVLKNFKNK